MVKLVAVFLLSIAQNSDCDDVNSQQVDTIEVYSKRFKYGIDYHKVCIADGNVFHETCKKCTDLDPAWGMFWQYVDNPNVYVLHYTTRGKLIEEGNLLCPEMPYDACSTITQYYRNGNKRFERIAEKALNSPFTGKQYHYNRKGEIIEVISFKDGIKVK